jgi:S1 RNA binding domain protein
MNTQWQIGDTTVGQIIAIKPYGAFVQLSTGDVGMVHISEVAEEYVKDIQSYLSVGQQVTVKIIGMNEEGKYNLSIKRLTKHEQEAALYFRQVQEFRQAFERRRQELQLESFGRRLAREKQEKVASSRASLLNWSKQARKIIAQISQRSEQRQRQYKSLDL